MVASTSAPRLVQIAAAVIGNALEWYDFIIFAFLTPILSRLFFPVASQYTSLILTTATFGVGFFMRPVGGVLLGVLADRTGRKAALLVIIGLMTAATAIIAVTPTYAQIGVAAPLALLLARLLQGAATGGEFAGATTFLVESAPKDGRGLYGSWQMVGQGLALLVGALLAALLTRFLSAAALDSWGWRVPFLFGLSLGPIGLFIRRHLDETAAFLATRAASPDVAHQPAGGAAALFPYFKPLITCTGLSTAGTISVYVVLLYMPTLATAQLRMPLDQAFLAQAIGLVFYTAAIPPFGALSDRVGRRPILIGSLALYLCAAYPLFSWLGADPSLGRLVAMQIVLCSLLGAFAGPFSTAMAEQFPVSVRSTGLAIAYNVAVMLFGGFAQTFVTFLIAATGSPIAPVFYVMFGAAAGIAATVFLVEGAPQKPGVGATGREFAFR